MAFQSFDEALAVSIAVPYAAADTNTYKPLLVGGTRGARVDVLFAVSTSVADHYLGLRLNDGTHISLIGQVKVPLGAGLAGVPVADILAGLPVPAQTGVIVAPGYTLEAAMAIALGAGEAVDLTGWGGQF